MSNHGEFSGRVKLKRLARDMLAMQFQPNICLPKCSSNSSKDNSCTVVQHNINGREEPRILQLLLRQLGIQDPHDTSFVEQTFNQLGHAYVSAMCPQTVAPLSTCAIAVPSATQKNDCHAVKWCTPPLFVGWW